MPFADGDALAYLLTAAGARFEKKNQRFSEDLLLKYPAQLGFKVLFSFHQGICVKYLSHKCSKSGPCFKGRAHELCRRFPHNSENQQALTKAACHIIHQ